MKYNIRDRVKLKTQEGWHEDIVNSVKNLSDRVVTIKYVSPMHDNYPYKMEEIKWDWAEDEIECLIEESKNNFIISRFEILDIR